MKHTQEIMSYNLIIKLYYEIREEVKKKSIITPVIGYHNSPIKVAESVEKNIIGEQILLSPVMTLEINEISNYIHHDTNNRNWYEYVYNNGHDISEAVGNTMFRILGRRLSK